MFRQGTHLGRCSLRWTRHQQGAPKKVKSQWYGPGMKWIFMHVSCRDLLWNGWILYANSWCLSHSNRETGKVLFRLANPCFWPPWWRLASWRRQRKETKRRSLVGKGGELLIRPLVDGANCCCFCHFNCWPVADEEPWARKASNKQQNFKISFLQINLVVKDQTTYHYIKG